VVGRQETSINRLPYDPAAEEIQELIAEVKAEPKSTIVLIGGSVAWGVGHAANETIASRLQEMLGSEVRVFNLSLVGARPLDQFLLAWALRDDVELLLVDVNYELGMDVERERLWREPETYLRQRSLLSTYGDAFFQDVPAAKECMEQWEITLPHGQTAADKLAQSLMSQLPLIHEKPAINRSLFGQHPLVLVERLNQKGGGLLKEEHPLQALLESPERRMPTEAWVPPGTPDQQALAKLYLQSKFTSNTLRGCLMRAFSTYAAKKKLPMLAYLTPLNPGMFPGLHASQTHEANVQIFTSLFGDAGLVNLDTGTLPIAAFTDSTHLTASGAQLVSKQLLQEMDRFLTAP
jgi:hypothetical protein